MISIDNSLLIILRDLCVYVTYSVLFPFDRIFKDLVYAQNAV